MEEQEKFRKDLDIRQCQNTTESLLQFKIDNQAPFWLDENRNLPKLPQMLDDIENWFMCLNNFHNNGETSISTFSKNFRFEILHKMIFYTSKGENEGIQTIEILDKITQGIMDKSLSIKKLEKDEKISSQIGLAILRLREISNEVKLRILTPDYISDVHKVLMEGLMSGCSSNAGEYRKADVFTAFDEEKIRYAPWEQVEEKIFNLCDEYNAMLVYLYDIRKESKRLQMEMIFKCASWFVIKFLKIHPFSDGNGRTARLIASYILGIISPIEIPIYNIYSNSIKDDYLKAVKLGQENDQYQGLLTIMIIESCWHMYKTLEEH